MEKHISQDNANQTLNALNGIADAWCKQFDNKPSLAIAFDVSEYGFVTLNGHTLGVELSEIDASSIFVDVEWFGFSTKNGDMIQVKVEWRYDESSVPRLAHVLHTPAGKVIPLYAQA